MNYTPYSFSKIEVFYQCPQKFKLPYIDNIWINSENKHLEKGSYLHEKLEDFFLDKPDLPWEENFDFKLHDKTEQFELSKQSQEIINTEYIKKLKKAISISDSYGVEQGFSFVGNDWLPDEYKKDSIIRGYIDLLIIRGNYAIVIDHKTGKVKSDEYQKYDQVMLYALWLFKKYPELEKVKGVYSYIEHNTTKEKVFLRSNMDKMEQFFRKKIQKIEDEKDFNKNVTKLCAYCDYMKQGYCTLNDSEMLSII